MPFTTTETLYTHFLKHPLPCTDTRSIQPGCLFFALKGPSFNGNAFAAEALSKGAAFAVIDEEAYATDPRCLLVADVLQALQDLARHHRRQLKLPVIGITGTNGKTTTKELVSAVLQKKYRTLFTQGNLNNHIGVPLTLLGLNASHEIAVIEMGANHVGEIAALCTIAEPDFGMITNIGKAHLEGFGGPEGVVKAKSEMYAAVRARGGTLFVNADDPLLMRLSEGATRITYGTQSNADVDGRLKALNPFVQFDWEKHPSVGILGHTVQTQIVGSYNLPNLLAAVCIGDHFNVDSAAICEALAAYVPSNNRSQVIRKGDNTILMDAYNANPSSMSAAVENFAAMTADNKLLILGDMLELGDVSAEEHQRLIRLLQEKKLDNALLIGPEFAKCTRPAEMLSFATSDEAREWLRNHPPQHTLLLVKGSRGMKLERVLEAL